MKNYFNSLTLFFLVIFSIACSNENPEPNNINIKAKIEVIDSKYWPENRNIVFEIYQTGNDFAYKSIVVEKPNDLTISPLMSLDFSEAGEYEIKLSIKESEIKKIVLIDYGTIDIQENLQLPEKNLQIVTLERLKTNLFSKCVACHGASERVAAGLYLLPDSVYANLVNKDAKNSSLKLVKPFEPENSFILKVMNKEVDFEHSASTNVTESQKELLRNWILDGARNN